jgi:hypothetical protein
MDTAAMSVVCKHIPNLFIVGAMKSGTTSLHHYLNKHSNIFMSELKEPGYFVEEINLGKGEHWYLSLFEKAQAQHLYRGESSTDYAKLPIHKGVAERIKAFNPDARIVFIARDPFARIVSHYWFAVRHISTGGVRRDFYTECKQDPQYISYSNYPMQVRPYLDLFGEKQFRILLFEDLLRDPKTLVEQILQWLGVDVHNMLDDTIFGQAWNARPEKIVGVGGLGILNRIAFSKSWGYVSPYIPKRWKIHATQLSQKTVDPQSQQAQIEKLRIEIRSELLKQTREMSAIMGRDLTQVWKL